MSDSFKTRPLRGAYRAHMDIPIARVVVEVTAKDLRRSADFYRLVGLDVPDADGPHVEVDLPGGNRLAIDSEDVIAGMHPGWTAPTSAGRLALALGLSKPSDVDALFERLTAAGHPGVLEPFDGPWGQRYATVTDPDGTMVDLFAALG